MIFSLLFKLLKLYRYHITYSVMCFASNKYLINRKRCHVLLTGNFQWKRQIFDFTPGSQQITQFGVKSRCIFLTEWTLMYCLFRRLDAFFKSSSGISIRIELVLNTHINRYTFNSHEWVDCISIRTAPFTNVRKSRVMVDITRERVISLALLERKFYNVSCSGNLRLSIS